MIIVYIRILLSTRYILVLFLDFTASAEDRQVLFVDCCVCVGLYYCIKLVSRYIKRSLPRTSTWCCCCEEEYRSRQRVCEMCSVCSIGWHWSVNWILLLDVGCYYLVFLLLLPLPLLILLLLCCCCLLLRTPPAAVLPTLSYFVIVKSWYDTCVRVWRYDIVIVPAYVRYSQSSLWLAHPYVEI